MILSFQTFFTEMNKFMCGTHFLPENTNPQKEQQKNAKSKSNDGHFIKGA